jgi:hypothetical protein
MATEDDSRPDDPEEPSRALIEAIQTGSDFAGATAGGAFGLLGGPAGVVAGAAAGVAVARVFRRVGNEVVERVLGPRQRVRVGGALAVAITEIDARLDAGKRPRGDGFFDDSEGERAKAAEILEGVLLHAANAYEERKVRYLGNLYAGIAFDETVSPATANFLLVMSDRLTYRQLAILALFGRAATFQTNLILADVAKKEGTAQPTDDIIAELDELGAMKLVGVLQEGGWVANYASVLDGGSFRTLSLARIGPTPTGELLFRLMELEDIPQQDVDHVLEELGAP